MATPEEVVAVARQIASGGERYPDMLNGWTPQEISEAVALVDGDWLRRLNAARRARAQEKAA